MADRIENRNSIRLKLTVLGFTKEEIDEISLEIPPGSLPPIARPAIRAETEVRIKNENNRNES